MARYMYGSEAEQITEVPVRVPRRKHLTEDEIKKQRQINTINENREKATKIGGLFTALVVVAMGIMLMSSAAFIKSINKSSANSTRLSDLKQELEAAKEANNLKELSIDTSTDYDYIYNVATKELGMVYAEADQIITYNSGESEYVMQFSDIPEN